MSSLVPAAIPAPVGENDLGQKLAGATNKLVVLEFVKPGSKICKYVETERNKIAQEMKDKAEFYELDVDTFKRYAEKLKVEALPAFVVMQRFVKKGHVVGTDDLKKAIEDAYAKFESNMKPNNSGSQPAEARNDINGSQPAEQHAPNSTGGQIRPTRARGVPRAFRIRRRFW